MSTVDLDRSVRSPGNFSTKKSRDSKKTSNTGNVGHVTKGVLAWSQKAENGEFHSGVFGALKGDGAREFGWAGDKVVHRSSIREVREIGTGWWIGKSRRKLYNSE